MALSARPGIVALATLLYAARAPGLAAPKVGHAARHGVTAKPLGDTVSGPQSQVPGPRKPETSRKSQPHPSAPIETLQFDGANSNDNLPFFKDVFPPPDPSGAAGPDHYFQAINLVFRIFDKSGNTVVGPLPTDSFWSGLGGSCETGNANTPIVRYDQLADRFLVSQAAFDPSDGSIHECIAVSTTGDPTGTYNQYDFPLADGSVATSARMGLWPDGYYLTVNQFSGFADAGFGVYAFDRSAMLDGQPATFVYADAGATHPNTLWGLPADLDGTTPPPVGAANVAVALGSPSLDGSPSDLIHVWHFHVDFGTPENSTFTGPDDVAIDPFTPLDCGTPTQGCVPQLDSGQLLQASPNRLMYRLPYRNFTDHESLVANFTVDAGEGRAGIRWFELRDPNGAPVVFQQATYAPDDDSHRFVGAIAMDRVGNVALGYSKSDATIHPSLAVTGRLVLDPPGTMGAESVFFEGPNSQPPVVGLWGFYSSMAMDPASDCTFWFTGEYTGVPAPFLCACWLCDLATAVFGANPRNRNGRKRAASPRLGPHTAFRQPGMSQTLRFIRRTAEQTDSHNVL